MKHTALDNQVDGNHYIDQAIQPLEVAYMLGGSPCFCKLVKYLTRNKGDYLINLRKALHVVQLDKQLDGKYIYRPCQLEVTYQQAKILLSKVSPDPMKVEAMFALYNGDHDHAAMLVGEVIAKAEKEK